ncbi:MAG: hypothetical protein E6Q98_18810 [Rhodospirillaceae bacterium]|nr:MAG: hypothetical protein E6Q98_18810 [Rhodospirillaceae bacterium]
MQYMPRTIGGKLAIILGAAFLLGAGAALVSLWIGAKLSGIWARGFAFYALVVGGGITMMLAAGLMTALFYSDRAGHDQDISGEALDRFSRHPHQRDNPFGDDPEE